MRAFASTLNNPPIVILVGVILLVSSPMIENLIISAPWSIVKIVSLVSYVINLVATTIPGRLDVEISADGQVASPRDGKTLLAPAFWGFLIWIPIYLGELILVIAQFFVSDESPLSTMQKKIAGPLILAQLFQSLWCASFRPKYSKHNLMYISAAFLAATANSLSRAHVVFTAQPRAYSNTHYSIFLLPLTLHFSWTTAASLVNFNGAFVIRKNSVPRINAWFGHASVIIATIIGVIVSIQRLAPVYGLVISWALLSVADSMKQRLNRVDVKKKSDGNGEENSPMPLHGAKTQFWLCRLCAFICVSASIFVYLQR